MTLPVPVLDDRTFDQLVAEAKARVAVHTPEWTNLNTSDPGVTILELFAFLTENLLYRSNRIPEANRLKFLSMLGISLEPRSPGRGIVVFSNDRGPMAPQPVLAGTQVRAGTVPFLTGRPVDVLPVSSAVFFKQPQPALDDVTAARYQLIYESFLDGPTEQLSFYQPVALDEPKTGKPDPVVDLGDSENGTIDQSVWVALLAPKGVPIDDVRCAIAEQTLTIGVYPAATLPGRVLPPARSGSAQVDPGLVFEIAAPTPDPSGLAGPGYGIGDANYARLTVSYADPVLQSPGVVQVTMPKHEKLLLWAFDPEEEGTGDYPPRVDDPTVSARLVTWIRVRFPPPTSTDARPAVPAVPVAGDGTEPCGCGCSNLDTDLPTSVTVALDAASDAPTGRLTWVGVNAAPVVQAVPVVNERLGTGTGTPFQGFTLANTPVLVTDGGCTIEVQDTDGNRVAWQVIDDIYAAAPSDTVYTLDATTGRVTFGNGLAGMRVPLGSTVWASYRWGGGLQGQVAIGALKTGPTLPGGFSVANPLATWGASDGESTADGEAAITRWLRHRDRLVTADDFRDLTRRTPGVDLGRVEILPLFRPDRSADALWPGVVTVLVIPRSDPAHANAPVPNRQFLDAVCAWLDPRRLITTELHVRGPVYQPIWVSVGIEVLPGQDPSIVQQNVRLAVTTFLSPLSGGLPAQSGSDGLLVAGAPTAAATGTGWPLGIAVRSQDIEAVSTRVPGVRYVDSVRIAAVGADGTLVTSIDPVPMTGLQLPDPTVFCNAGPADDPAALLGSTHPAQPTQIPVPLVPPTC